MNQRTVRTFSIDKIVDFKQYLFAWSQQFETLVWLDSNNYKQAFSSFDCALAVEEFTAIKTDYQHAFEKLKEYQTITKDYIFGYISYDVKNDVEQMTSNNLDELDFADLYFFQPQKLIFIKGTQVEFHYLKMVADEIDADFKEIKQGLQPTTETKKSTLEIKLRIPKEQYYTKVANVIEHIKR
jgi:para-aminobenzoate synthetase component 1